LGKYILPWGKFRIQFEMTDQKKDVVQSVDAATVSDWVDRDQVVLVDVRETSEFDKEHIPGALLLPMSKFDPELFPTVPGKNVVLHCAIGKRSESAGKMLINEGYEKVLHMAGGIDAWKAAGFATEVQFTPPSRDEATATSSGASIKQEIVRLCPPPGHVLKEEYLEPLKISQQELAEKIGMPDTMIRDLVNGDLAVNVELSLRLARYFSTAADFWIHLQIEHDLESARHQIGDRIRREVAPRTTVGF
jgi:addiction module HigA family antidote